VPLGAIVGSILKGVAKGVSVGLVRFVGVAVLISLTTCPGSLAAVEIKDLLNSLDEQLRNAEHQVNGAEGSRILSMPSLAR
jgi:uncharacterized membrane protein SpoIIM required for sporulation